MSAIPPPCPSQGEEFSWKEMPFGHRWGGRMRGRARNSVSLRQRRLVPQITSLRASPGALQGNLAVLPAAAALPLCRAQPRVSSPARLCRAGGALLGVMFVMFPGSPSRKTSLKHRGFPSAGIQMNPKQSPLQSGPANEPLSPPPRPGVQEGPNDAAVLQRRSETVQRG